MDEKEIILNKLLDQYEKSKSFQGDSNRRILLKMRDIKQYNIEDYEEKEQFHDIIKELKQKNIIEDFTWEKFEKGNILKELWLNKQNVEKAYEEIGRSNKKKEAEVIIAQLSSYEFSKEWIKEYQKEMIKECKEKKKAPSMIPYEYAKDILIALSNLKPEQEILKRVFSIKCYGDSKYFENHIENYLIRIVKKYMLKEYEEMLTSEEILLQVGIVKAPEIIEFCGNIEFTIGGEKLRYSNNTNGSYLNNYTIQNMENLKLINIKKIIWIENKTNYLDYILNHKQKEELVIYHGGMYSPTKGKFFQKIRKVIDTNVECYHWSDIDIGGFKIFIRLQKEIVNFLKPYQMEKADLEKMRTYWKPISKQYKQQLEKMYSMEEYAIFKNVIKFMIENECKLEQESFIADSN